MIRWPLVSSVISVFSSLCCVYINSVCDTLEGMLSQGPPPFLVYVCAQVHMCTCGDQSANIIYLPQWLPRDRVSHGTRAY